MEKFQNPDFGGKNTSLCGWAKVLSLVRNAMGETARLISGIQHPGSSGGVYETTQHFNDIKEHLHVVKRDIEHLVQRNMVLLFRVWIEKGLTQRSPKAPAEGTLWSMEGQHMSSWQNRILHWSVIRRKWRRQQQRFYGFANAQKCCRVLLFLLRW